MRKDQVDRQPDEKPVTEPYTGGHDPKGKRGPNPSEKDKRKAPRRPEEPAGHPVDKMASEPERFGKDIIDGERSDRPSSGRPVQLEEEEKGIPRPGRTGTEPGRGDRPREAQHERRSA